MKVGFICAEWLPGGRIIPVYIIYSGFLRRNEIPYMVWVPKLSLGKKKTWSMSFLLFGIILYNLLHLIHGHVPAQTPLV